MSAVVSRRIVLAGAALAAAHAVVPAWALTPVSIGRWRWSGTALGARASIVVDGMSRDDARRLVRACRAEVHRLERIFSLYRTDSALSVLNRDGVLDTPPPELVEVLSLARLLHARSGGAFDVTVQPLWSTYQRHFSTTDPLASGPAQAAIEHALRLVDFDAVQVDMTRVRLARRGMALTLNGIAQGFVTDRVSRLAERAGCERVLLDVGEIRTLGSGWRIGMPGSETAMQVDGPIAVATSEPSGFRFEDSGRHHHLFDPVTGRSTNRHAAVTVLAPSAALADGLSTACAALDHAAIERVVAGFEGVEVRLLRSDGVVRHIV